jgi:hypothetical protein
MFVVNHGEKALEEFVPDPRVRRRALYTLPQIGS